MMLSALDLARRIEDGSLTPAAALALCAEAIATHEAEIGAFTVLDLEGARGLAERDGAALSACPLRGLPVGVKDIFDTTDFPTEYGSPIYRGHRPATDASIVMMVRRAGGIVPGKTVTTEFAYTQPAATRNPHNLERVPGGSSSGSAAAVAAGMLPIALGSQTGSSTIKPAAFCGVAGFKPSYRIMPTVGAKCLSWSLDTIGLFAASIADVAFAAAAITGRDLRIDTKASPPPRIALLHGPADGEATPDMRQALKTAGTAAAASGAAVTTIEMPPILNEADAAHRVIIKFEAYRALAYEYDRHRDRLGPMLTELLDEGRDIADDDYDAARRTARRARQAFAEMMADIDVLLMPSAAGAAPLRHEPAGTSNFNRLWTLLGAPCLNVPGLADGAGMPLGLQVIGRFGRDRVALEAAAFVERAIRRQ